MTPEHRKFRGQDAKQLLDNELFQEAFAAVGKYLDAQALSCDPDNAEKARRIVISKQLLAAVKREIEHVAIDGQMAQIQMAELDKKKRFSIFQR